MTTLIPLSQVEPALIERLLDRAFGPDRHHRTAYRIREGTHWLEALSFAALDEDEHLAGTIQLWPIALIDQARRAHPMLMVGPVAVVPERQRQGLGKLLVLAALDAVERLSPPGGALPQVMIGDPAYYGRFFGFSAAPTAGWHCPGPVERERLLVRSSNPAVLPREGTLGPWKRQDLAK